MAAKAKGAPIGAEDDLCCPLHVGDEIKDINGNKYTIDQYGRAKPLSGGNSVPVNTLEGLLLVRCYTKDQQTVQKVVPVSREVNEEEKEMSQIEFYVHAAGDQRLVDELRSRGWNVTCAKITEKVVYEEVAL